MRRGSPASIVNAPGSMKLHGDDPGKDFRGIRPLGFRTIRVRQGRCADVEVPPEQDAELSVPELSAHAAPLPLSLELSGPGDEILVLGYPAGINALLARSGSLFVDSLLQSRPDFWKVVEHLSASDLIHPLASRGIVGQVTPSSVVYDAETTRGGSGGPVLSLKGEVVAVTYGVLEGFGGSNLGVPVEEVRRLIEESGIRDSLPQDIRP